MKRPADKLRLTSVCAFTLTELMVATGVGSIIALCSMGSLVEGTKLFRCTSTEMVARDEGSRAIRKMSTAIQASLSPQIYSNYLGISGTGSLYGSCIVLQTSGSNSVAYYRYASSADPNSGGIYYDSNAATAPNPATDKLLASSVQDLEFRRDPTGCIRAGFKMGIYGYPSRIVGGKEADTIRYTTSSLPRN